ncbi:hypothetical protein [Streptomyces phaeochromogenes]|uniref:hypothetical protein n=1 Tax=Streptomyces phaeochromogenes TaxID=1923 RepID=UPI003723C0F7
MSKAAPRPENHTGDEAAFDAWLATVDNTLHDKIEAASDIDAGCAQIFASSVTAETASTVEVEPEQWDHLEAVLRDAADSIAHWLALAAPHNLSHQLNKAISTTRTMTVVGRALLPESMRAHWGLAADFLAESYLHLTHLKSGLVHHALDRQEALSLHTRARSGIATFQAALQHVLPTLPAGSKPHHVIERLLATVEMLLLLLDWSRDSIVRLFDERDLPAQIPSTNHR